MNDAIEAIAIEAQTNIAAKRCSDFDEECADVECHATCFAGSELINMETLEVFEVEMADGYCPYLVGMMRAND